MERTALFVVSLSSFVTPLMLSAVNVAIPEMAAALHVDTLVMNWVPTAYLLTSAVFLLPFGRLADLHGRRKIFLGGMIIVTLGSALAACASSAAFLIGCRLLQGLGAAMLFSTGVAILSSIFPKQRRGGAIGISVSMVYLGLTGGPLIGGWVTSHLSWRAVFLVPVPMTLLVTALALSKLRGEWKDPAARGFDPGAAFLYGLSICALMYGFSSLPAWTGWLIIGAGAAGMIVFVRGARTSEAPLFDVNLFAGNRVFAFSCLASFIAYSSTFGISYLMSLYLQYLKGLTPQAAGTVMVAQPVMMALFSPFSGRMADRFEPRHIASLGLLLVAAGLALLSRLQSGSPLIHVVAGLMLVGFGFALFSPPNVHAIMSSVDSRHLGTASGSVGTARVLGQTFSMGIVSLVFAVMMGPVHLTPQHFAALSHSISDSFAVAACLSFAGVFLSLARGDLHGTAR